jgi:hypothetical protein
MPTFFALTLALMSDAGLTAEFSCLVETASDECAVEISALKLQNEAEAFAVQARGFAVK